MLPKGIKILDSSKAVTKRIQILLKDYDIASNTLKSKNIFLYTGNDLVIKQFLSNRNEISKINI